jgi:hypothetical protein
MNKVSIESTIRLLLNLLSLWSILRKEVRKGAILFEKLYLSLTEQGLILETGNRTFEMLQGFVAIYEE